jgi:hypothetical protein
MTISETARVARDRARRGDGKFGEQAKDRPPLTPHEEAVTGLVLDTGGVSDEFVTGDVTDFSRAHLPWSPSSGADRMEARVAEAPPSPARGGDAGEVEPPRSVSSALWSIQSGVENQDLMWQFGGDLDDAYRGVEFLEQQLEAVTAERDQARDELVTARRSVAGYRCDAEGHLVSYEHERER